jgi:5-formyltetrahydrofolate cyclo-ligase
MGGIKMDKKHLRKETIHKLNEMNPEDHLLKSQRIQKKVLMEETLNNGEMIGITLSAFPEVETWSLVEKLWAQGKQVAVPKCDPLKRTMQFYKIDSFDQLEVVYMKLKEPVPDLTTIVEPSNIDVLIVPGVVFDRNGYRIGFGGGYYDRFLSGYGGDTISLAFDCQIVDSVPAERYDLPVKCILTETKRIQCSVME